MLCLQTLLLAACLLAPAVLGVIHNLDNPEEELVQPLAIDISSDHDLRDIAEDVLGPDFFAYRGVRQTDTDESSGEPEINIGTTARLDGTRRHYFALVHWTGHPSEVLFIVTMTRRENPTDSCLWRSTDYGKTFSNDTYKLNDSSVVLQWYYVGPYDSDLIMADVRQNKIYVTRDEGETYVGYNLDFTPDKIRFQGRTIPNVLEDNLPEHILGYDERRQELHVSRDLGGTWTRLGGNVSRNNWRVLGADFEASTAVYFEADINDTHAELMVTEDPYEEMRVFDSNLGPIAINSTVFSREFILVQKPVNWTLQEEYSSILWVSAFRRPFRQARFPLQLQEEHYAVMDASQNRVFLAVYHSVNETTHLYISDSEGVDYSLSLDDIVGSNDWEAERPKFDIHVVEGMPGRYVVNRYNRLGGDNGTEEVMVATVISYDKGGRWSALTAPTLDLHNAPTLCQPPLCSLHLRMATDTVLRYSSIQSQDSAIGLILAQGNVGASLVRNDSLLHVYLSRDGGFSWQEMVEGHWSFQMVALGSILVMIPKRATVDPVDYVLWSCDEGSTWKHYTFTDTPIRLVGMLLEKGEKSRHVTIFGYYLRRQFAWLIIELDFTEAVPTQCSQPDDYFIWTPSDGRPDARCVLGARMMYERRRIQNDVCCYIDPNYERPISRTPCPCTVEDYECDGGFEQVNLNGPCVPMEGTVFPPPPPQSCTEGATYISTLGYRKVVGDICIDQSGSPFAPANTSCPPLAPEGLSLKIDGGDGEGISPGQALSFSLTQEKGWTLTTLYTWDFGDEVKISGVGLLNFGTQSHTYDKNGHYTVKVIASNGAGQNLASLDVQVGGDDPKLSGVSSSEKRRTELGVEVGVSLMVILIMIVAVIFILIVLWYRKRYHMLQVRYRTLQEGAVPMTLSQGEFQEDFGCAIDDDDKKGLVDDNKEEV